ncbi:MAG: exodeoxyribonuclease III [Mangrovibacterium sp.]
MKRIVSYNVNGIRAALKKDFLPWLQSESPDVICLQETKAQPGQMSEEEFNNAGYYFHCFSAEKKGYSGVAILSKEKPVGIKLGMDNEKYDVEGRVIRADFSNFSVISAYFPSGTTGGVRQDYKMDFLDDFTAYLQKLRKEIPNLVVCGDYNICRLWMDIHNPDKQQNTSGFLPEEREWFEQFVNLGFIDSFRQINQEPHHYSWWSYRAGSRARNKGWRIDYNMVTDVLHDKIVDAGILNDVVHSDHCPVWVALNID